MIIFFFLLDIISVFLKLFMNKNRVGGVCERNKKNKQEGHYFQEKNIIKVNSFFFFFFQLFESIVLYIDRFKLRCHPTFFRQKYERKERKRRKKFDVRASLIIYSCLTITTKYTDLIGQTIRRRRRRRRRRVFFSLNNLMMPCPC
jgi:hypothetical protein